MVYEWKSGSRIKGNAQESGELFKQLSETKDGLTAETLLEANKPETAPLHNDYEWNDEKAAHEWRLHQSRHFINSIAVKVVSEDTETDTIVRAFHIADEPSHYEPITAIIKEKTKYEHLLQTAYSELQAFRRKYSVLKELKPIFESIEKVVDDEKRKQTLGNSNIRGSVSSVDIPHTLRQAE